MKKPLNKQSESLPLIDEKEVLEVKINKLKQIVGINLGGKPITESEMRELKTEADFLSKTKLWKVFQETLKHHAYQVMFEKSQTFDDMRNGKMMLYNLSVQKNIVEMLENYKTKV